MDLGQAKNRLVAELKADKKKAAMVGVLVVVAAVVGVRMIAGKSGTAPIPATVSAGVLPEGPGGQGKTGASATAQKAADAQEEKRDKFIRNLDPIITRNIFEPSQECFPLAQAEKAQPVRDTVPGSRSMPEQASREKVIREEAASLHLQSTILGASPTAIINGRVLRVGEWVEGFEVLKIDSQTCIVRKEKVNVELGMNQ